MAANGKGVLQRVDDLEGQLQMAQQQLRVANNATRQLLNVFTGLVTVLGEQLFAVDGKPGEGAKELDKRVAASIAAAMEEAKRQAVESAKGQIKALVDAGQLLVADGISKESIVTFAEYAVVTDAPAPVGQTEAPEPTRGACTDEFAQMPAARFTPDVFKDLEGKGVGYVYRQGNSEIEISGVYNMAPVDLKKQIAEAEAADVPATEPSATEPSATEPSATDGLPTPEATEDTQAAG